MAAREAILLRMLPHAFAHVRDRRHALLGRDQERREIVGRERLKAEHGRLEQRLIEVAHDQFERRDSAVEVRQPSLIAITDVPQAGRGEHGVRRRTSPDREVVDDADRRIQSTPIRIAIGIGIEESSHILRVLDADFLHRIAELIELGLSSERVHVHDRSAIGVDPVPGESIERPARAGLGRTNLIRLEGVIPRRPEDLVDDIVGARPIQVGSRVAVRTSHDDYRPAELKLVVPARWQRTRRAVLSQQLHLLGGEQATLEIDHLLLLNGRRIKRVRPIVGVNGVDRLLEEVESLTPVEHERRLVRDVQRRRNPPREKDEPRCSSIRICPKTDRRSILERHHVHVVRNVDRNRHPAAREQV